MRKALLIIALAIFGTMSFAQGIDTTKWTVINNQWINSNTDLICNLPSMVSLNQNALWLTSTVLASSISCTGGANYGPANKSFTGGSILAKTFNFKYGAIEARIKGAGNNVHGGNLWMMGAGCQTNAYVYSPWCNNYTPPASEVDICEVKVAAGGYTTFYYNLFDNTGNFVNGGSTNVTDIRDWHVCRLEWSPTALVFKVDGATIGTITTALNENMFPLITEEVETALGTPVIGNSPTAMVVDYIRVWDSGNNLIFSDEFSTTPPSPAITMIAKRQP